MKEFLAYLPTRIKNLYIIQSIYVKEVIYKLYFLALGAHLEFGPNGVNEFDPSSPKHLDRYKRQLDSEELLNLSPEELCKDRVSEEYFRLTTEGDCRDVVR